jgi:hypothetical protein
MGTCDSCYERFNLGLFQRLNMKTEMQQLEESAKEQYYKERVEELFARLREALDSQIEALRWKHRTGMFQVLNITAYFAALAIKGYYEVSETYFANTSMVIYFATFVFLLIREGIFESKARYHEGVFDGIFTALETLYPNVKDDTGNDREVKKVKRKALFPRFKELFERLQGKNKQEAYGGAI